MTMSDVVVLRGGIRLPVANLGKQLIHQLGRRARLMLRTTSPSCARRKNRREHSRVQIARQCKEESVAWAGWTGHKPGRLNPLRQISTRLQRISFPCGSDGCWLL